MLNTSRTHLELRGAELPRGWRADQSSGHCVPSARASTVLGAGLNDFKRRLKAIHSAAGSGGVSRAEGRLRPEAPAVPLFALRGAKTL